MVIITLIFNDARFTKIKKKKKLTIVWVLYYVYLRIFMTYSTSCGPGSSVGKATDYGLDGPRSNPGGDGILGPSRPALRPTQPPVQWVPGLSWG